MPNIELTLRPRTTTPLKPAAWLLPGHDASLWLEEIARWPVDHSTLQYVAIRGVDETSIDGLVALSSSGPPMASGRSVALGCLADNFYIPIDAELFPSISPKELTQLLSRNSIYVWLPGRGLTAAEPEDLLGTDDLIELPEQEAADWNQAMVGIAFPSRLTSIRLETPPSIDDVLGQGREDIGNQASHFDQLPKTPQESKSAWFSKVKRAMIIGGAIPAIKLASFIKGMGRAAMRPSRTAQANKTSASSNAPRQPSTIANMASRLGARIAQSIEAERNRELHRLFHLLENDPDQGLKFALPFGGQGGAHRGLSSPGNRLGQRNVDFNLRQLGGGGPADMWDMPAEYQSRLISKYRELAGRETRLGRFRRAAYIYAHLLGDFRSAASTLEQGKHFHEAAVLYRDSLNDSLAAAKCLERGELWSEAIEAYRGLGRHEKVGDLLTFVEQHDEAALAYQQAAHELIQQEDLLGAARIHEQKLADNEQAIAILDAGWPNSSQARQCLLAAFAIRGRVGWHDAALTRVIEISRDATAMRRSAYVAEILADLYETYPAPNVQMEIRRISRSLVANRLRDSGRDESARLVSVLSRLDPNDRLLRRDGVRFLNRSDKPASITSMRQSRQRRLQRVGTMSLELSNVLAAVRMEQYVVAVAREPGKVIFACLDVSESFEERRPLQEIRSSPGDEPLLLFAEKNLLQVFPINQHPRPDTVLFPSIRIGNEPLRAGTPRGLDRIWGAAIGRSGNMWAIAERDDPALVCVNPSGNIISTRSLLDIGELSWEGVEIPIPMHVAGNYLLVGIGHTLLIVRDNRPPEIHEMPHRIMSLAGRNPYAAPVVVAALEVGVAIIRVGFEASDEFVAPDLQQPIVMLSPDGFLFAADEHKIVVQELLKSGTSTLTDRLYAEADHQEGQIAAILPGESSHEFLLVSVAGRVSIYQVSS